MKTCLYLIPGLLCDEALWASQIHALAAIAEVRVAATTGHDSLGALAEALIADAPEQFAVAGHSMGGRIALEVARRVPARLTGVALLDSGCEPLPAGDAGAAEVARRREWVDVAWGRGMRAMAQEWVKGMVHPERLEDPEVIDCILDMFERRTPEQFEMQVRALLGRPDARGVLPGISCPALVLCGAEDTTTPLAR